MVHRGLVLNSGWLEGGVGGDRGRIVHPWGRGAGHVGCRGDFTELGGRVLEGRLVLVALLLEQLQVLPQDVSHEDGGARTKIVLAQTAHFSAVHLKK